MTVFIAQSGKESQVGYPRFRSPSQVGKDDFLFYFIIIIFNMGISSVVMLLSPFLQYFVYF